jgi:hypothetical protein
MRLPWLRYLWIGLIVGIVCGVLTNGQASEEVLRRVGIDESGQPIDEAVDSGQYRKEFRAIVDSVADSSLGVLNRPATPARWQLQTLVVGVGVGMEFGVGPILKVKATPRLRVVLSRSDDPALP